MSPGISGDSAICRVAMIHSVGEIKKWKDLVTITCSYLNRSTMQSGNIEMKKNIDEIDAEKSRNEIFLNHKVGYGRHGSLNGTIADSKYMKIYLSAIV